MNKHFCFKFFRRSFHKVYRFSSRMDSQIGFSDRDLINKNNLSTFVFVFLIQRIFLNKIEIANRYTECQTNRDTFFNFQIDPNIAIFYVRK